MLMTWLLWPRDPLLEFSAADQSRYFTAQFIARAESFRGPQSWLALANFAIGLLVPLACAWLAIRRVRTSAGWLLSGRVRRAAAAAAGVLGLTLIAQLPLRLLMQGRAGDVGLSLQSTGAWLLDWLLAALITLAAAAVLAAICAALIKWAGRAWWLALWAAVVVLASGWQLLAPIVIEPIFADFTRVPAGELRGDVERVAKSSGVDAGEIFEVDAASRTTGVNAYVSGLGATRRVVLYDTLVHGTPRDQRSAVIAHEFGHARHRDLLKGLIWFSVVALIVLAAGARVVRSLLGEYGIERSLPLAVVVLAAVVAAASAVSQPSANALSRAVEARADAFALAVTGRPLVAIELERTLTVRNVARPDPPAGLHWFFGTHPTPVERIGMAEAARRLSAERAR